MSQTLFILFAFLPCDTLPNTLAKQPYCYDILHFYSLKRSTLSLFRGKNFTSPPPYNIIDSCHFLTTIQNFDVCDL